MEDFAVTEEAALVYHHARKLPRGALAKSVAMVTTSAVKLSQMRRRNAGAELALSFDKGLMTDLRTIEMSFVRAQGFLVCRQGQTTFGRDATPFL
jgi:hypothetical protein